MLLLISIGRRVMLAAEARERLSRAVDFRGDTPRVTVRRDDLRRPP